MESGEFWGLGGACCLEVLLLRCLAGLAGELEEGSLASLAGAAGAGIVTPLSFAISRGVLE